MILASPNSSSFKNSEKRNAAVPIGLQELTVGVR